MIKKFRDRIRVRLRETFLLLRVYKRILYDSQSNPNDPVTWHMVQQQQQQLQYNETGLGTVPSTEVRIRILVGEKGRLGCGVCRGIVPGLTVQVNHT